MKKLLKQKISIMVLLFSFFLWMLPTDALANSGKDRVFGQNRIETSIEISKKGWKSGADNVFITYGYDFADALTVTPLAKKYNGPILLSGKNGLDNNTIKEIQRLNPKKVFILGGEKVLSKNTEAQLKKIKIANIERIFGNNRYETALKVSEKLNNTDMLFISNGQAYADALSIASIAAQKECPILYTNSKEIPKAITNYISKVKPSKIYFVGGNKVIEDSVLKTVKKAERISGENRYDTNKNALLKFNNEISYENVYFACGNNFADALSVSPMAALSKSPIILTGEKLDKGLEKVINDNITSTSKLTIVGGEKVVAKNALDGINDNFEKIELKKDNEVFGEDKKIAEIKGDIIVTGNNVTLNNVKLAGNLILDPGEKGTVNVKNTVCKNIIVKSGDVHSINLTNTDSENLIVESKNNVSIKLYEDSKINNTKVKCDAILKNTKGSFGKVEISGKKDDNHNVEFVGKFDKEVVITCDSNIKCDEISAVKVDIKDKDAKVKLEGNMENVTVVNCDNVLVSGKIDNISAANKSKVEIENNTKVNKAIALDSSKIIIKDGASVSLIEKNKNASIEGKADKVIEKDNPSSGGVIGGNEGDKPKAGEFTFIISKNGSPIKTKTLKVEEKKNAMQYLKENADAKDNQGFIYEIDGLKNMSFEKLTDEEVKSGILGKDWFIYLNGSKTPVGAAGVKVKEGDTLTFDYREWDWHDLVAPDYDGAMPLKIHMHDLPFDEETFEEHGVVGQAFRVGASCVYQKVYGATVKVDDEVVGTTDRNGNLQVTINTAGEHTITIEKEDGKASTVVNFIDNNTGGNAGDKPKDEEFTFVISKNGSAIKTKTLKVEENKNAMQYLKENTDAKDNQGFIYEIDGLKNMSFEKLTDEEVKRGILGKDWFIYLNGSKTPVGAAGVKVKEGDTLTFDYREWDWHDVVAPDYEGSMPLTFTMSGVRRGKVEAGKTIKVVVSCVYQKVYGATVKIDGSSVGVTGRDGIVETSITEVGKHKITVEKDGGIVEKYIEVIPKKGTTNPGDKDKETLVFTKSVNEITLTIKQLKDNKITFNIVENKNSSDIPVTIKVLDEKSNLAYIDQHSLSNGKCELSTILENGKFNGACKIGKTLIDFKFEIK
ncbi:MAG: cell wall-binding repeat-containing protein [Clostridium sp.]